MTDQEGPAGPVTDDLIRRALDRVRPTPGQTAHLMEALRGHEADVQRRRAAARRAADEAE